MHLIDLPEPRRLLSASLTSGTLRALGSSGSDIITISLHNHAYNVNINGAVSSFPASSVRSLVVRGNAGNDKITLSGKIKANTTIRGDDGDDTIQGSNASEQIIGGAGADSLRGGAGDDTIPGRDGADTLFGQIGGHSLFGA